MAGVENLICCGVKELYSISSDPNPTESLRSAKTYNPGLIKAHIIFTGASVYKRVPARYAENLKQFILDNNYGTVVKSPAALNPNSGCYVTTYVWTPNIRGKRFVASL